MSQEIFIMNARFSVVLNSISVCVHFNLPERKYKVILNLLASSFLHLVKNLASLIFRSVKVGVSLFYLL